MIEVKKLTKAYGANTVVKDISFVAKDGAITGFIGHNGAGKSTTIKAITGVIKPTKGNILINGIDIEKDALNAKRQFGYVCDSPDHFLRRRVRRRKFFSARKRASASECAAAGCSFLK